MEVRPGYKQTEVGVIPNNWEVKPFTEVTNLITCGIAATPEYVNEIRGYPFLSSSNVKEGRIVWSGFKHITTELHRQLYRNNPPKKGDILYSRVGTFGEAAVVDVDFEFSVYVSLTLIKPDKTLDSFFLAQLLNSDAYKKRAKDQIYLGGGVGNLNVDVVRRYPIVIPPLPEQRAIATALSDVDALLGALDRLIAKKRDLKQAAMQQLLTGQTRLPGFHGKWEDTTLGSLATFLSGGTPSRTNDAFWEGDIPWISASSLRCFEIWRSESNVTKEAVAAGSKMAPVGSSLLLVRGSALHKEILCGLVTKPVCFNQDVKALVPLAHVVPRFLTIMIRGMEDAILRLVSSAGNTAGVLDTKLLKAFAIQLPKRDEQTAIAEVLSDMDTEIAALEQRREKTRALKQGMMQELLTGKTRLVNPSGTTG